MVPCGYETRDKGVEILMDILKMIMDLNWVLILGVLLAVSEALALIPGVKSHGIFKLILRALHAIDNITDGKKEEEKK